MSVSFPRHLVKGCVGGLFVINLWQIITKVCQTKKRQKRKKKKRSRSTEVTEVTSGVRNTSCSFLCSLNGLHGTFGSGSKRTNMMEKYCLLLLPLFLKQVFGDLSGKSCDFQESSHGKVLKIDIPRHVFQKLL